MLRLRKLDDYLDLPVMAGFRLWALRHIAASPQFDDSSQLRQSAATANSRTEPEAGVEGNFPKRTASDAACML